MTGEELELEVNLSGCVCRCVSRLVLVLSLSGSACAVREIAVSLLHTSTLSASSQIWWLCAYPAFLIATEPFDAQARMVVSLGWAALVGEAKSKVIYVFFAFAQTILGVPVRSHFF